ncbi:MAG: acetylglutamate kinase [Planctomycetota bacterium]|nr:MAG: acetylglutamate kinase [Planctomycetota bacterium]
MKRAIQKAETLVEALPYIKEFSGSTIVIKYGGSAMNDQDLRESTLKDIVLLKYLGMRPVIVHGGGKHISELLKQVGKEVKFLDGLRVTDKETMKFTQMVLAGQINKDMVSDIHKAGGKACGLSGKDGHLLEAKKMDSGSKDYGFVGEITQVNTELIDLVHSGGFIPVISPIAVSAEGDSLNINADIAAAEIAIALNAEKIIYLTDVNGILRNVDDPTSTISHLTPSEVEVLDKEGILNEGMVPKMKSCIRAIKLGVKKVHIINGTTPHSMLLEIFTQSGIGTEIVA